MSRGGPWLLRHPGERGVIGVIVAILAGGGLLIGLGTIVVDVGQLFQNRAEIQNAADAASFAVADSCATGTCSTSVASTYAGDNTSTGNADVTTVCGSGLITCALNVGALIDCPVNPTLGTNYVDVAATAESASGSTVIPPVFAGLLPGLGGLTGSTVKACSQTEWGSPSSANTIGFTISACTWDADTLDGLSYAAPPPYPPNTEPASSYDQVISLGAGNGSGCLTEPSGSDGAGAFGWTNGTGCSLLISSGTYGSTSGASGANACISTLQAAYTAKSVVFLPVYTKFASSTYTLKGFAAFVVTGYTKLTSGATEPDWLNPANSNACSFKCIDGYFTRAIIPATGPLSSALPDLGASAVNLTG